MGKKINSLIERLRILFPYFSWYLKFRQNIRESKTDAGLKEKIWALLDGFYLETIKLCRITRSNAHEFLSDKAYNTLHPINRAYSSIIDNKLYLPFLLKDFPEFLPQYYYFIDKGRLVKIDKNVSNYRGIIELCKLKLKLVLKHCYSSFGQGFYLLEWKENNFFLNNVTCLEADIVAFIDSLDNYIVTEYIYQNHYACEINGSSANTIRLLCIWDEYLGEFYIPRAFHRFGISGRLVDNLGSEGGGILAFIDIHTGKIKDIGVLKEPGKAEKVIKISNHPGSKTQIAGIIIPFWFETIRKVTSIMNQLSFLKYVGMDIVITETGFKIIELNSLPTLSIIQIEEGLLKNDRMKKFFTDVKYRNL